MLDICDLKESKLGPLLHYEPLTLFRIFKVYFYEEELIKTCQLLVLETKKKVKLIG